MLNVQDNSFRPRFQVPLKVLAMDQSQPPVMDSFDAMQLQTSVAQEPSVPEEPAVPDLSGIVEPPPVEMPQIPPSEVSSLLGTSEEVPVIQEQPVQPATPEQSVPGMPQMENMGYDHGVSYLGFSRIRRWFSW